MYGGYFTRKLLESDVGQHSKLLFSSFTEFLCFRACGNAASLLFMSKMALGRAWDGWLLTLAPSYCSSVLLLGVSYLPFFCSLVCYSLKYVLI